MNFSDLTPNGVMYAMTVFLILIVAYNTIMTAVKNYREEKTRKETPSEAVVLKFEAHDRMLANDKERLDKMDEQSIIMLRAVRAILSHEINGNSVDKLRDSMTEIDDYLISKR